MQASVFSVSLRPLSKAHYRRDDEVQRSLKESVHDRNGGVARCPLRGIAKKANPNEVSNQSSSHGRRIWTHANEPERPLTTEGAALVEQGEAGVCTRAQIGRIKAAQTREFTRERGHSLGSARRRGSF